MTAVIGVHLRSVLIVAADTRESDFDGGYIDGVMKIEEREGGGVVVTGAGVVDVLADFKAWVMEADTLLIADLPGALERAASRLRAKYEAGPWRGEVEDWLKRTNLLAAVAGTDGLRMFRLNALEPQLLEKQSELAVMVIPPPDVSDDFVARVRHRLERKLAEIDCEPDETERLGLALGQVLLSVALFSRECVHVSPTVNFAVVWPNGVCQRFEAEDMTEALDAFSWPSAQ